VTSVLGVLDCSEWTVVIRAFSDPRWSRVPRMLAASTLWRTTLLMSKLAGRQRHRFLWWTPPTTNGVHTVPHGVVQIPFLELISDRDRGN
jgi:hypothetical protein